MSSRLYETSPYDLLKSNIEYTDIKSVTDLNDSDDGKDSYGSEVWVILMNF